MKRIFVPTQTPSDWQHFLAKPKLHWKKFHSAMTTAACWEAADGKLPPEVNQIFQVSGQSDLRDLKLLVAFPEWEVELPGGARPSHTDVLALARNDEGLVVIGVEAKVDEPFGPTLGEKRTEESNGQSERISYLHTALRLDASLNDNIRYQFLHRTVSVIRTAQDFHAGSAVMLVHSFSLVRPQTGREDFLAFCQAMSATQLSPDLYIIPRFKSHRLYLAWCPGDGRFLNVELPSVV